MKYKLPILAVCAVLAACDDPSKSPTIDDYAEAKAECAAKGLVAVMRPATGALYGSARYIDCTNGSMGYIQVWPKLTNQGDSTK